MVVDRVGVRGPTHEIAVDAVFVNPLRDLRDACLIGRAMQPCHLNAAVLGKLRVAQSVQAGQLRGRVATGAAIEPVRYQDRDACTPRDEGKSSR
jgi:hypothetical protein